MNLKLIITDAFQFFRYHIGQIAVLCLPWLLAISVVEYVININSDPALTDAQEGNPLEIISFGFYLLINPIYTAALILLMEKRAKRETPNNKDLLSEAIQIWQPLFILNIIIAVILYPALFLAFQGWPLILIPAIFVAVRISFSEFYLVLEEVKPLEAIKLSFNATQPYFFHILMLFILFIMPLWLIKFVAAVNLANPEIDAFRYIFSGTSIAFMALFIDVLMFRVYMSATQKNHE